MNSSGRCYAGSAESALLDGHRIAGTISVHPDGLHFSSGETLLSMPFHRLTIERVDKGQIAFSDPEVPDWLIVVPDEGILDEPLFATRPALRLGIRRLRERRQGRQRLILTGVFLAIFPIVTVIVMGLGSWTTRFLVGKVPVAWERELGDSVLEDLKKEVSIVKRPDLMHEIELVMEYLNPGLPKHPYEFHFYIIDDPGINAFALPGGHILVHTGLFSAIGSREELAGVLAHEIAHVTQRHGLRRVVSSTGPYLLMGALIREKRGFFALLRDGSGFLIHQTHSREHEHEADDLAWRYMVDAGIDPRAMAGLLAKLRAQSGVSFLEDSPLQVLSSHPPTSERIERLERKWKKHKGRTEFVDLRRVKRGAPRN